jgi:hypothetical protein
VKRLSKALIEGSFLLDLDERDIESIFRDVLDYVVTRGVLPAERREEVEAGVGSFGGHATLPGPTGIAIVGSVAVGWRQQIIGFSFFLSMGNTLSASAQRELSRTSFARHTALPSTVLVTSTSSTLRIAGFRSSHPGCGGSTSSQQSTLVELTAGSANRVEFLT